MHKAYLEQQVCDRFANRYMGCHRVGTLEVMFLLVLGTGAGSSMTERGTYIHHGYGKSSVSL